MGIEPTTSSLPRKRSTPELRRLVLLNKQCPIWSRTMRCEKFSTLTQMCEASFTILKGFRTRAQSGRRGSNPRPTAWKAVALPTELLPHTYYLFFLNQWGE